MTFEQICAYHGWEPKAVRAILKSGMPIKIEVNLQKMPEKKKRKEMIKFFEYFIKNIELLTSPR